MQRLRAKARIYATRIARLTYTVAELRGPDENPLLGDYALVAL
jgi:hypothetical protein